MDVGPEVEADFVEFHAGPFHVCRYIVGLCRDIEVSFLGFGFVMALSQHFFNV